MTDASPFGKNMKKIVCLIMVCLILVSAMTACSKAPDYSEIEDRLKELIEASYEINAIFFGSGLATYERVTDPRNSTQSYTDVQTGVLYHYYWIEDEIWGRVLAVRQATTTKVFETDGKKYFYFEAWDREYGTVVVVNPASAGESSFCLQMRDTPIEGKKADYISEAEDRYGYRLSDYTYEAIIYLKAEVNRRENEEPYAQENGIWYYLIAEYTEPTYESFYDEYDPIDYDFVRLDCGYVTVADMKEKAETVYSSEYLQSIYDWLFVGTAGLTDDVDGLSARYIEYVDDEGVASLMKSNTFEPLITERRIYDFSTATMVKPSNKKYVNIEIDSYLESDPTNILRVRISMQLQNGVWLLDSATY